jgi:hypothetical protein
MSEKLLFEQWDISTNLEFMLSWFIVLLVAILLHAVNYHVSCIEFKLLNWKSDFSSLPSDDEGQPLVIYSPKYNIFSYRLAHSCGVGLLFALDMFLMLIAMQKYWSLFGALIIGYGIGDYIYFVHTPTKTNMSVCH